MTFDLKLNCVDTCAKSNNWYFPAQTPAYLCWIETRNTSRSKWWNSFICSQKSSLSVLKIVYKHDAATEDLSTYRLSVPNIDPKHDSLQVHWQPIWQEIVSKSDVLQVMFVYMILTFSLIVQEMGSKHDLRQLKNDVLGARYVKKWELKTQFASCDKIQVL